MSHGSEVESTLVELPRRNTDQTTETRVRSIVTQIFFFVSIQKFTPQSAQGIHYTLRQPLVFQSLSIFGIERRGLSARHCRLTTAQFSLPYSSPALSTLGSLIGIVTFAIRDRFS